MSTTRSVPATGESAVELAPANSPPLDFHLDACSFSALGNPTFERWQEFIQTLSKMEGAIQWWLGDALNYGEHAYGQKYCQAVDPRQASTWMHYSWVARSVAICSRKQNLSYKHHEVIAKLDPPEQEHWLDQAIKNKWSVRELRAALRGIRSPDAWTVTEALAETQKKLECLLERWPADSLDVFSKQLREFADEVHTLRPLR